ncbi:hypothetical protein PMAC_001799 [Pneumocystis sp. 'macacae']|nr:hypothetical protein PMAC_001799 [Pneumocystis sp. 'macacae']
MGPQDKGVEAAGTSPVVEGDKACICVVYPVGIRGVVGRVPCSRRGSRGEEAVVGERLVVDRVKADDALEKDMELGTGGRVGSDAEEGQKEELGHGGEAVGSTEGAVDAGDLDKPADSGGEEVVVDDPGGEGVPFVGGAVRKGESVLGHLGGGLETVEGLWRGWAEAGAGRRGHTAGELGKVSAAEGIVYGEEDGAEDGVAEGVELCIEEVEAAEGVASGTGLVERARAGLGHKVKGWGLGLGGRARVRVRKGRVRGDTCMLRRSSVRSSGARPSESKRQRRVQGEPSRTRTMSWGSAGRRRGTYIGRGGKLGLDEAEEGGGVGATDRGVVVDVGVDLVDGVEVAAGNGLGGLGRYLDLAGLCVMETEGVDVPLGVEMGESGGSKGRSGAVAGEREDQCKVGTKVGESGDREHRGVGVEVWQSQGDRGEGANRPEKRRSGRCLRARTCILFGGRRGVCGSGQGRRGRCHGDIIARCCGAWGCLECTGETILYVVRQKKQRQLEPVLEAGRVSRRLQVSWHGGSRSLNRVCGWRPSVQYFPRGVSEWFKGPIWSRAGSALSGILLSDSPFSGGRGWSLACAVNWKRMRKDMELLLLLRGKAGC